MNEIYLAEAVFRVIRERQSAVKDMMVHGNVKSMEQYRKPQGNLDALNYLEQELKCLLDKQGHIDD